MYSLDRIDLLILEETKERDIENYNFEPLPGVYCSYDHEKCSIKS